MSTIAVNFYRPSIFESAGRRRPFARLRDCLQEFVSELQKLSICMQITRVSWIPPSLFLILKTKIEGENKTNKRYLVEGFRLKTFLGEGDDTDEDGDGGGSKKVNNQKAMAVIFFVSEICELRSRGKMRWEGVKCLHKRMLLLWPFMRQRKHGGKPPLTCLFTELQKFGRVQIWGRGWACYRRPLMAFQTVSIVFGKPRDKSKLVVAHDKINF